jgi:hypothetical protein
MLSNESTQTRDEQTLFQTATPWSWFSQHFLQALEKGLSDRLEKTAKTTGENVVVVICCQSVPIAEQFQLAIP